MDERAYTQAVERLTKVNEVIASLDPAIRSDAFAILKGYVTEGSGSTGTVGDGDRDRDPDSEAIPPGDHDALIEKYESDKDYENAMLALALFYDRHGRGPLQLDAVKSAAKEFNLTVPKRLDKFFDRAKRDDKEVLRKQSDGWKITPVGRRG